MEKEENIDEQYMVENDDKQSMVEKDEVTNEDDIECAHCDLKIETCEEYTDANRSNKCEDCNKLLCSPCVKYTELYQKKKFSKQSYILLQPSNILFGTSVCSAP